MDETTLAAIRKYALAACKKFGLPIGDAEDIMQSAIVSTFGDVYDPALTTDVQVFYRQRAHNYCQKFAAEEAKQRRNFRTNTNPEDKP